MRVGSTSMRAARWHRARDVRVEDVPIPEPGPGEVLIRIDRAGICGSDLEEYLEGPVSVPVERPHPLSGGQAPLILGHELVGTVVSVPTEGTVGGAAGGAAAGAEPTESAGPADFLGLVEIGTRVVPNVVVGCGSCWWCLRHDEPQCPRLSVKGQQADGGLAEYMTADASTLVRVPPEVPVNVAAFAEPTAVAVRSLRKAGDLVGATVVVIGAGVIGQLVVQVAYAAGAVAVVAVDPVAERRRLAESYGATTAEPADARTAVESVTDGRGGDVVLECSGARGTVAAALDLSRRGGTVVLVGFRADTEPLPLLPAVLGERRILGTAAHLWDVDVASAVGLLSRGVVDTAPLLSGVVPLSDVVSGGFEHMLAHRDTFKILVDPVGGSR